MYLRNFPYLLIFCFSNLVSAQNWYEVSGINPEFKQTEFRIGKKKLSIASYHYLKNKNTPPKKTIITVHGYLVNCHYLLPIHEYLLERDFEIFCVELPGLGQSEGPRAQIADFKNYQEFINQLPLISSANYLLVHSTGAVGVIENIIDDIKMPYEKVFMITPLVRNYHYTLSKFAFYLGKTFIDSVPRTQAKTYPNKILNSIHANDPYWINATPVSWVDKLIKWNNRLEKKSLVSANDKFRVFYSENDTVVETSYNQVFLEKLIPKSKHHLLTSGTHYPFFDPEVSKEFFKYLDQYLK